MPRNARACPECGSDELTGWSQDAYSAALGLPEENFDYDDFVEREFHPKPERLPRGIKPVWWIVALVLALVFLTFWLRGLF